MKRQDTVKSENIKDTLVFVGFKTANVENPWVFIGFMRRQEAQQQNTRIRRSSKSMGVAQVFKKSIHRAQAKRAKRG